MSDRELVIALIGKPYQQLYLSNAVFKQKVDTLALMLPEWIAGMAITSEEQQRRMDQAIEFTRSSGLPLAERDPIVKQILNGDNDSYSDSEESK